jgi:hypothetical protein
MIASSSEGHSGVGASAAASGATGAPGVTLTTSKATSLVFGVTTDWSRTVAPTLGSGLVLLEQWLDAAATSTFWSAYTNATTGAAGSPVRVGASAPTGDRWDLVAVELLNGG